MFLLDTNTTLQNVLDLISAGSGGGGGSGSSGITTLTGSGAAVISGTSTSKHIQIDLSMFSTTTAALPKIGVAFNPFFPPEEDSKLEQNRLLKKIQTEQVDKVYLQFGSNLERLRSSLQWLSEIRCEEEGKGRNLEICGSIWICHSPRSCRSQLTRLG